VGRRLGILRPALTIEDLLYQKPELRDLNDLFRNRLAENLLLRVYREAMPTGGIWIVRPESADPELKNVTCIPVDRNHGSICKPLTKSDQVYTGVSGLISEVLGESASVTVSITRVQELPAIRKTAWWIYLLWLAELVVLLLSVFLLFQAQFIWGTMSASGIFVLDLIRRRLSKSLFAATTGATASLSETGTQDKSRQDSEPAEKPQTDAGGVIVRSSPTSVTTITNGTSSPRIDGAVPAASNPSPDAALLHERLLSGAVPALDSKLALLTPTDRQYVVNSLASIALKDDKALAGLGEAARTRHGVTSLSAETLSEVVRTAVLLPSIDRKIGVLELGAEALKRTEPAVLEAFFQDVFEVVARDRFKEVNRMVNPLVNASLAVPPDLRLRYFQTILRQADSNSHHGAPAAQRGIANLPAELAQDLMGSISTTLLLNASSTVRVCLKSLLEQHAAFAPTEHRAIYRDFIKLPHRKFVELYDSENSADAKDALALADELTAGASDQALNVETARPLGEETVFADAHPPDPHAPATPGAADWDEATYLDSIAPVPGRRLRGSTAPLPANVQRSSAANPLGEAPVHGRRDAEDEHSDVDVVATCLDTRQGELLLVMGPGGSGKSSALRMTLDEATARRRADSEAPLPVLVPLGRYRTSLRSVIEDELGLPTGRWDSIRGVVLLLCDGLNEIGPPEQAAIVTELSLLGRRGRVATVITLRETGLPAPIVFPPTTHALRLHPFTFKDIREWAAQVLDAPTAQAFLAEIRARLTDLGTSIFELPFGVATLMRSFRERGQLPGSLGELVEGLLQSRFDANEEIVIRQPALPRLPRSIVSLLARHVAEEMRLHRRRTIVNSDELQEIARHAVRAIRERDVFDAEGVRDRVALDALLMYEVLFRDRADTYHFEHEIVAGFLVKERLAANWAAHLDLLAERSLDEAWVLAARHVHADECERFFAKLCETDPILAARSVVERGQPVPSVESYLIGAARAASPSLMRRWEIFTAMSTLATPDIITELRSIAAARPESYEGERAIRALCSAGDSETLARVLDEADPFASFPGASGGALSDWQSAPPQLALAMARVRVQEHLGGPVGASLRTIEQYGELSDVPLLFKTIEGTNDLNIALYAYSAAAQFDAPGARRALLGATASEPSVHVRALEAIGAVPGDAEWLFDFLLSPEAPIDPLACNSAAGLLARLELTERLKGKVRAAYEGADIRTRKDLWMVAQDHKLTSFEPIAVEALRSAESAEVGHAANFAAGHTWSATALRDEFVTLARAAVENDWFAFEWDGWRLATFILSHGDEELVGRAVERRLRRVVAAFASLPAEETRPHGASDVPVSSSRSSIRSDLGQILLVAGAVAERIPKSLILDVFRIEARFSSEQATASMVQLLARVEATDIDAAILAMDGPDKRIEAACLVAPLGSTPTRVQIVGDGFKDNLEYPALLTRLSKAARHLWSDELLRRIVQSLVRGWGHKVSNIREHKLAELAELITKEQAETILAPLLPRLTTGEHHVRQTLELWHDLAKRRKE